MSEENVEIVRRAFDASVRRDPDAFFAVLDPAIEWDHSGHPSSELDGGGISHGHEGVRALFREWYEPWDDVQTEIEELIDAGEQVVIVVADRGRGKASGLEVRGRNYAGVWTLRDGKVVRVEWFSTREAALASLT